ncbi:hypothetical protein [Nostoc sp. MG11]|uniref:hypothetical protein n=1 Tax=Nostoc sp. MG11 TaxID=2721166 RepID=UPI001866D163|nr:hypothetical protein [Nostoc sp. MG11]
MKVSIVAIISALTVSFVTEISLAGSSRRTLDSGTVIITCNNNSGRSEAQFQLISSVGTIGVLDFDLKFNNGENIKVSTPTQVRKSITGFRDARGLASRVTIVGQAYGFDNNSNPYTYIIPSLDAVCDHNF